MTATPATMTVTDAINARRSVRSYQATRLDRETINTLLAAAIRAPNAVSEQQWAFVVVQGKPLLDHLSKLARPTFAAELARSSMQQETQALPLFANPDFNIFYDADTLIVICTESTGPFVTADCWLAAENLILTACSIGLGTCIIGSAVSGLNTKQLKAELGIGAQMTVVAPIIVGVPNGETPASLRANPRILSWKDSLQ